LSAGSVHMAISFSARAEADRERRRCGLEGGWGISGVTNGLLVQVGD
jgi:hypothetical protein